MAIPYQFVGVCILLLFRREEFTTQSLEFLHHLERRLQQVSEAVIRHWPARMAQDIVDTESLRRRPHHRSRVDRGLEERAREPGSVDILAMADLVETVVDGGSEVPKPGVSGHAEEGTRSDRGDRPLG